MNKSIISMLFVCLISLLSIASGKPFDKGQPIEATVIDPEATVRSMLAAADKGDLNSFMGYWAPKFEIYFNGKLTSTEDLKKRVTVFKTGFPDVKRVIDEVVVSGNMVTVRGWMTGTNTGKFMDNAPTGKSIKAHLLCIFRLNADGKVESGWVDTDMETLKSQLKS